MSMHAADLMQWDVESAAPSPRWYHFHLVEGPSVVGYGNVNALTETRAVSAAALTLAGLSRVVLALDCARDE